MGRIAQKRLVRKRDLERVLSKIEAHPLPKVYLEQYTTPSSVVAETLYLAAYVYDDIIGKTVVDLGCGTGRLAIGAALLGARETFGVDVDKVAVNMARKNAERSNMKQNWLNFMKLLSVGRIMLQPNFILPVSTPEGAKSMMPSSG